MSTAIMMVDMVFCEAVSFLPSIVAKTQLNAPMNEEFGSVRELSGWRRRIAHIDAVVTENVSSKKQSLGLIRDAPQVDDITGDRLYLLEHGCMAPL